MGLLTPSGSLTTTSLPKDNDVMVGITSEVPDNEDNLDRLRYPSDIYHNDIALNTDRESEIISQLVGFAEGTPIIVTWFHQLPSNADEQSQFSDLSFMSDPVNNSYLRINGFEIKLTAQLEYSYNQQQTQSQLTGEALVYPGFNPLMGDLFIYALQPGQLGIFKVNAAPQRLTIKKLSGHVVSFELIKILNTSELNELLERVRDIAWFDKQRFLSETAALLTSDDVRDIEYIDAKYAELLHYYHTNFYDKHSYKSYMSPDGVYDPYLVDFLKSIIPSEEIDGDFINQLLPDAVLGDRSFWMKLRSPKVVDWTNYVPDYYVDIYQTDAVSYRVNSLINRNHVILTTNTDSNLVTYYKYISDNIGGIDTNLFNDFESMIAFYMEYQVIDTEILKDLIENIYEDDKETQFYRIPILLYFIKVLERSIRSGKPVKLALPDQSPYIQIPFEEPSDQITNDVLTIVSPDSKVVGMIDNNGDPIYPEALDITYTADGFTIDLSVIKAEQGIVGSIPGTWYVVVSNTSLLLV